MVGSIHAEVFRIAEHECPRLFGKIKAGNRPDKFPAPEEIASSRFKFMRDINKINERISNLSGRNPDDNLNKSWGDWLTTVQTTLEIVDENKKNKPQKLRK